MLESIKGLSRWHHKDCIAIYRLWRQRIVKQDESDSDPEFITTIGLGWKLASYWKTNWRQFWKWRRLYKAYKNPISKFDVGQMNYGSRGKTCKAHVVSTTRGGTTWSMD